MNLNRHGQYHKTMKPVILVAILFTFLTYIVCGQTHSREESQTHSNEKIQTSDADTNFADCVTLNFHYLIISDYQVSPNTRTIEVFLDEKAFNEENLKALFRFLSDKNPDPNKSPNNLGLNTGQKIIDI